MANSYQLVAWTEKGQVRMIPSEVTAHLQAELGEINHLVEQLAQAAKCCLFSSEWDETEWGDVLCRPLQGRFFAMFCACKEMARKYPRLKYAWVESGLQGACNRVTHALRLYKADLEDY